MNGANSNRQCPTEETYTETSPTLFPQVSNVMENNDLLIGAPVLEQFRVDTHTFLLKGDQ